jgi:glycosyltransferase involved in cell wall biosynthesis
MPEKAISPKATPLVSVIVPAYNAEKTILETVQSVLQQTFSEFELIVINDGSTDGTLEVLATVGDPRLAVFSYENGGLATARNRGVERSSGEFITFIDADDLWTPEKIESQVAALQQSMRSESGKKAGVAYSWTRSMDAGGELFYDGNADTFAGDVYAQLLRCNFISSGSNIMLTRQAIAATGVFDDGLRYCEDWEYYLRLAREWPFVVVPQYQVLYRQTRGSLSSNVLKMEAAYVQVCDRAFQNVPEAIQKLKPECLARVNQHLTQLCLKSSDDRQSLLYAQHKLWQATLLWPKILLESKTHRLLFKLIILGLSPVSGAKLLKRISVQRGSRCIEV